MSYVSVCPWYMQFSVFLQRFTLWLYLHWRNDISSNSRRSLGSLGSACLHSVCLIYNFHIVLLAFMECASQQHNCHPFQLRDKVFGSSSAATKALCMRFFLHKQRVLYLSWLTHDWDTKIGNTFTTTMLHNLEYHHTGDGMDWNLWAICCQPAQVRPSSWLTPPLCFPYGSWWVSCSLWAHQLFWLWSGIICLPLACFP